MKDFAQRSYTDPQCFLILILATLIWSVMYIFWVRDYISNNFTGTKFILITIFYVLVLVVGLAVIAMKITATKVVLF